MGTNKIDASFNMVDWFSGFNMWYNITVIDTNLDDKNYSDNLINEVIIQKQEPLPIEFLSTKN